MPEVFHVISDRNVGGAGIFLCNLLAFPQKNQGSPVLLPEGSLLCSRLRAYDVPYMEYPCFSGPMRAFHEVKYFSRLFRSLSPTLVVSHASVGARFAAKKLHISTLAVKHCDLPIPTSAIPLYNLLTDATVATSRHAAMRLRCAGIKNVMAIENGICTIGVPSKEERYRARRAFGGEDDRIRIGLAGRLSRIKGQEVAISALAHLGEKKKNFLLCFLGEGEDRERLEALTERLGLKACVRFFGFHEDPRDFYHAMDAHISCSYGSETSSLSLAEGMSAGCPSFASDTPGNRERLGEGGLLFPAGDSVALSHLFLRLTDQKEKERLHTLALGRAQALPAWDEVRASYAKVFRAFCGELARNGCNFRKDML